MGRENCCMYDMLKSDMYCDYYYEFYYKCEDLKVCPDGLDSEGCYDNDYYDDNLQGNEDL